MFPNISALSLVLPVRYLDNRLSAAKAREVSNNECRFFPSVHALYFYRSSWPFLRILLPSSLSVCLPASLQLVTTAEPDRRLAAIAYSLSASFSAKWNHRWRKKIEEKEDQNKILLMLGFFCCSYVLDHSVKIRLFLLSYPLFQVPPPLPRSLCHSVTFRSWKHRLVRSGLCQTWLCFDTVLWKPAVRGMLSRYAFSSVWSHGNELCALLKAVFCNPLTPTKLYTEAGSRINLWP
jgi:hypothetical protein